MKPFSIAPGHNGYNLDRCEEVLLIDAWIRVRPRIPPEENWTVTFEDRFFRQDKGVSDRVLESVNHPALKDRASVLQATLVA